ncbi:MAG: hypothetical protein ACYS47_04255 [Planctomycetota bacterium]|jgi:hypothetical protein
MKRPIIVIAILFIVGCNGPAPREKPEIISLDVMDKELWKVVTYIRDVTGRDIQQEGDLSKLVIFRVEDMHWEEVLKLACEKGGATLRKSDEDTWVVSGP